MIGEHIIPLIRSCFLWCYCKFVDEYAELINTTIDLLSVPLRKSSSGVIDSIGILRATFVIWDIIIYFGSPCVPVDGAMLFVALFVTCSADPSKNLNSLDKYCTMHHFATKTWRHVHTSVTNGALWDVWLVHCGKCTTGIQKCHEVSDKILQLNLRQLLRAMTPYDGYSSFIRHNRQ